MFESKHLRILGFFTVIGIILCAIFVMRNSPSNTHESSKEFLSEMEGLSDSPELHILSNPDARAFKKIVDAIQPQADRQIPISVFRTYYDSFGPELMLDVLDANPLCHSQAHNLGRAIYERTNSLAASISMCQSKCTQGCIHGAVMGLFSSDSDLHATVSNITPALEESIRNTCEDPLIVQYTGVGNCYHAIGHALMAITEGDVRDALELCGLFEEEGLGAKYYCATGVYMQEDIEMGIPDAERDLYPCDSAEYPAACYRYKVRRLFKLPSEYDQAKIFCASLEDSQRHGCFHGLGFGAYKMVYQDQHRLNDLCVTEDLVDEKMCLEGVLSYIGTADRELQSAACITYTAGSARACMEAAQLANFGMDRDFKLYTQQ